MLGPVCLLLFSPLLLWRDRPSVPIVHKHYTLGGNPSDQASAGTPSQDSPLISQARQGRIVIRGDGAIKRTVAAGGESFTALPDSYNCRIHFSVLYCLYNTMTVDYDVLHLTLLL